MIQRTWWPRLNPNAQLAKGLVFAGLGGGASTLQYADASFCGNHGTLTNMDPPTDWVFDPTLGRFTLDFDGSNDFVNVPLADVFKTQNFAVSCWIRAVNHTNTGWYSVGTFLTDGHAAYTLSDGETRVYLRGEYIKVKNAPGPPTGSWFHFCYMRNGTAITSWFDGVAGLGGTASGTIAYTDHVWIGKAYPSGTYDTYGKIADFCVWNRPLSNAEVQQLADPSNTLLSGLILPPRRMVWPVAVAGGDGAISGSTSLTLAASGTLAGSGALAGSSSIAFTLAGTLSGTGSLTGSTTLTLGASGTLAGAGSLAGASSVAFVAAGALSGSGALAGSSSIAFAPSGTLAGAGALAGTSSVTFAASGTLHNATPIGLEGSTGIAFGASGTLTGAGSLTGTAAVAFSTAGTLTGSGALAGSSSLTFAATGTLEAVAAGAIAGSTSIEFAATGELTGWGSLAGVAELVFGAAGVLRDATALVDSWIIDARQVHVPGWESAQAHIAGAEELDGHGQ